VSRVEQAFLGFRGALGDTDTAPSRRAPRRSGRVSRPPTPRFARRGAPGHGASSRRRSSCARVSRWSSSSVRSSPT
jgi:hypothetical protein